MTHTSTEQERAEFTDGAWYWVEKEGWHDEPPKIAPAMYRADCDAWYSWEFSGISTEYLKVLEPCVRHEQAARRAPAVPQDDVEAVTKAILFEDTGSTADWQGNTNLGLAAIKAYAPQGQPFWFPHLRDRADGVKGHYSIARCRPDKDYLEFIGMGGNWVGYGARVFTLEDAQEWMRSAMLAAAPQPEAQAAPQGLSEAFAKFDNYANGFKDGHREARHAAVPVDAKQEVQMSEPECWYDGKTFYGSEEAAICACADMQNIKKLYTEPQVLQHVAALEFQLDELAMLTRMLIRALRKVAPENKTAARAVDYLKRKGLTGNPLRGTFPGMQEAKNVPSPADQLCLSDAQCDRLITALCPDFSDESFPGDREVLRNLAREALATNEAACICLTPEQVQAQLIEAKDDLYKSRIGMSCSQCAGGVYVADGNGYHDFHRCSLCRYCPMWSSDGSEFVAGKTPL